MPETLDHNAALKHGIGALITRALAADDIEVALPLMEAQLIVKRRDPNFVAWVERVTTAGPLCLLHGADCRAQQNGRPCTGAPADPRPRGEHLQLVPKIKPALACCPACGHPAALHGEAGWGHCVGDSPVAGERCGCLKAGARITAEQPPGVECAHEHLEPNPLSWMGLPMCADCHRLVPAPGPGATVQNQTIATDVDTPGDRSPTVVEGQPTAHNSAYVVTDTPAYAPDQQERQPLIEVRCVLCDWSQNALLSDAHAFLQAHIAADHGDCPHAWHAVTMPNGEPVEPTCPQCGDHAHPAEFGTGTAAI